MKRTLNELVTQHEIIKKYYEEMFYAYTKNELFKVYNVEDDKFQAFAGPEGSLVMNASTIISGLTNLSEFNGPIGDLIVLRNDENDVDFIHPVFIGATDAFK